MKMTSEALHYPEHLDYPMVEPVSERINRPFWSVMIPTYNSSQYLEQTLHSVLEQDPGPDEMQIKVIDDCSPKNDPENLVREIGKNRVDFYRQPQNLGISGNWNSCIQQARGHWIHILHQDDLVLPGFYHRLRSPLTKDPTIGAAFCRNIYMDGDSNWQSLSPLERKTPGILSGWIEKMTVSCKMLCPAVVVKRQVYEQLGGFHGQLHYALDWDMWKRIAVNYPIWYEPQPLACYRLHAASASDRLIRTGANIAELRKSIELSLSYSEAITDEILEQARDHQANFAFHLAKGLLNQGDIGAAIVQVREGLKCSQSSHVLQSLVSLLALPESESLLKIIAQLLTEVEQEQIFAALSDENEIVKSFNLRDLNLMMFPDWQQSEELLYNDLASAIATIIDHPEKNQITLLIDTSNIDAEEANLMLSGMMMNLLVEKDLDVTDGPEISLLGQLGKMQWSTLLPYIDRRIVLKCENQQAIIQAGAEDVRSCELDDLKDKRAVALKLGKE